MKIEELLKKALTLASNCGVAEKISVYTSSNDGKVLINFSDWEYEGDSLEDILLEAINDLEALDRELKEGLGC